MNEPITRNRVIVEANIRLGNIAGQKPGRSAMLIIEEELRLDIVGIYNITEYCMILDIFSDVSDNLGYTDKKVM